MNKRSFLSGFFPRASAYLLCGALLLTGVVCGTFLSSGFCRSGGAEDILAGFLAGAARISELGTATLFGRLLAYPLLVFLLGLSVLGVVGIPAACFLRGFTLAFALSTLTRLYAGNGALLGILLFGAASALSVPVFLLLASGALTSALRLTQSWFSVPVPPEPGGIRTYFLRFLAAALALLVLAAGERAVFGSGLLDLPIFS